MQTNGQPQNQQKPGLSWSTPNSAPVKIVVATPVAPVQKTLPTPLPSSSNMAGYISTLVGGIVFGVLLAWGYSAMRGDSTLASQTTNSGASAVTSTTSGSTSGTKTTTTTVSPSSAISAALTVASPQKAGMSVAVSNVVVTKPTWVVVYDNIGGKLGNALGAHLFFTTGSGTVTLLRPTKAGTTYFVGTRIDNGDRKYAKASDIAATANDGSLLTVNFVAQ